MASSSSSATTSSSSRLAICNVDGSVIETSAAAAPQAAAELKSRVIPLVKAQQDRLQILRTKIPFYRDYLNAVDRRFIGLQNKYKLEPARVIFFGSALDHVLFGGEEPKEIDLRIQITQKFSWTTTASKIADWASRSLPKIHQGSTGQIRNDHVQEYCQFEIHHPQETHYTDLTIEHAHTPNRTHAEFTSSKDALRATINLSDEDFSTLELHVAQNAFQVSDVLCWNEKGRLRVHPEHIRNTKDGLLRIICHLTAGALFDQPSSIIDDILCETLIKQYKDDFASLERKIEQMIQKKYKKDIQGAVFFLLNFERFFSKSTSALVKENRPRIQTIVLNALCKKRLGSFDLNISEEGNLLAFCRYYLDEIASKMVSETGEHFAYGKYYLLPFQGIRIKDQRFTADERLCNALEKIFPPKDPDWRKKLIAEPLPVKAKPEEKAEPKKAGKAREPTYKSLDEFLKAYKKMKNPNQTSNQLLTILLTQPTSAQNKARLAQIMDNLVASLMKDPKNASNIYNLILAFFKSLEGQPLENQTDIRKWIDWFLEKGLYDEAFRLYIALKDPKILDGICSTLFKLSKNGDVLPRIASFVNMLYAYYKHYEKEEEMAVLEKLFIDLFKHVPNGSRFYFYNLTREAIDQFSPATYFAIFSSIVTFTDWDNLKDQTRLRFEKFVSRSLTNLSGKPISQDPQEDLNLKALADRIKTKGFYLREDCIRFLKSLPKATVGRKAALAVIDSDAFKLEREINSTDLATAFLHHVAEEDFVCNARTYPLYLKRVEELSRLHLEKRGLNKEYEKKLTNKGYIFFRSKKEYNFTLPASFEEAEDALIDLLEQPDVQEAESLQKLYCEIVRVHLAFLQATSSWHGMLQLLRKATGQTVRFKQDFLETLEIFTSLLYELGQTKSVDLSELLHSPELESIIDQFTLQDQCRLRLYLAKTSSSIVSSPYLSADVRKFDALMKKHPSAEESDWFQSDKEIIVHLRDRIKGVNLEESETKVKSEE